MRSTRTYILSLLKQGPRWSTLPGTEHDGRPPSMLMQLGDGNLVIFARRSYQEKLRCGLLSCGCRKNSFIWVSPSLRAVYFEVPKAASSSIRKLLELKRPGIEQAICQAYLDAYHHQDYRVDIHCASAADYEAALASSRLPAGLEEYTMQGRGYVTLKPGYTSLFGSSNFEMFYGTPELAREIHPDYFSFTVVRNPLDRMVSNWSMFTQKKARIRQLSALVGKNAEGMDFPEFCAAARRYYNHHWEPQTAYIPAQSPNLPRVEFVAKLETIGPDWQNIADRLGMDTLMSQENTSRRGDYNEYLTESTRQQLLVDYRSDFQCFYPQFLS